MANETTASNNGTEWTAVEPQDGAPTCQCQCRCAQDVAQPSAAVKAPQGANSSADDEWAQGVWSSTIEPHHIPGYCGVIPGAKFEIARSIGPLSSDLLRDNNATGSGNLVLTNFSKPKRLEVVNRPRRKLLEERTKNLLKDKYFENMCVPGYTGHIPLKRQQFGGTYADDSFYGLSEFENNHRRNQRELAILKSINHGRLEKEDMFPTVNVQVPMRPIAKEAAPYISKEALPYPVSPYAMKKGDPQKYFMSGYRGFVPRVRFGTGRHYTHATRECIVEFNDHTRKHRELFNTPVILFPEPEPDRLFHDIYPNKNDTQGMTPNYTGYIPGTRQKIGMSFSRISLGVRETLHQDS